MSQRNVPRHCFGAKTAQTRFINHNSPSPKKMARTTQSKILAISSNLETIMLLLIVGELWDPEVPESTELPFHGHILYSHNGRTACAPDIHVPSQTWQIRT